MKNLAIYTIFAMLMVAVASCDGHLPGGILVEKEYNAPITIARFSPATHTYYPVDMPPEYIFKVKCDSCGLVHCCHVEKDVFDKYNVGDTVTAKGYYHGQKDK